MLFLFDTHHIVFAVTPELNMMFTTKMKARKTLQAFLQISIALAKKHYQSDEHRALFDTMLVSSTILAVSAHSETFTKRLAMSKLFSKYIEYLTKSLCRLERDGKGTCMRMVLLHHVVGLFRGGADFR